MGLRIYPLGGLAFIPEEEARIVGDCVDIHCNGDEDNVFDCSFEFIEDYSDAGVLCMGKL